MKKAATLGVAAALLAGLAATAAYAALQQTFTVKLSSGKAKKGSSADLTLAARDPANPGALAPRATRVVIVDPGSYKSTNVPRCAVSSAQLAATQCALNTVVGKGEVKAAITTNPISRAEGPVQAYNLRPVGNEVARLGLVINTTTVQGDGPGALPAGIGSPTTFDTKITRKSGKSVLTTDVPKVEPLGPGGGQVNLTDLRIIVTSKKFHKNGKCKTKGKSRKGKFKFQATFNYANGTSKTVGSKVGCKR